MFLGLPIRPEAWIFVFPSNEKPLFRSPETQLVVPVTVPVRELPDESDAEVPLVSFSFEYASSWPSSPVAHSTMRCSIVSAFAVIVLVSTTPHCTGICTRRPAAVLLLLMVLAR